MMKINCVKRQRIVLAIVFLVGVGVVSLSAEGVFKSSPRDKNIGYLMSNMPVPMSSLCLDSQVILIPGTNTTVFYGAAVEPSVAINPLDDNYIVAAWQQGKIYNGGALEIAIARSDDGGHEWHRTVIPMQNCIGGFIQRMSDCWLSYSPDGTLYLVALPFNATRDINTLNQSGVVVSVSQDNGKSWTNPHWIAASQYYLNETTIDYPVNDKTSITADRNISLNAYCVWDQYLLASEFHSHAMISLTHDGGVTWSPNAILYDPALDLTINTPLASSTDRKASDNVIVVVPTSAPLGGSLMNFMTRSYPSSTATDVQYENDSWPYRFTVTDIAFVRSVDQGATWDTNATVVATIGFDPIVYTGGYAGVNGNLVGVGSLMRTANMTPSFAVNPVNGYLYVVWQTSIFNSNLLPQIALSTSRDSGATWSAPVKVSQTPTKCKNPQAFTPFVAVDGHGHVGVLYSDFRKDRKTNLNATKTNTWLAIFKETVSPIGGSTGVGLDFKKEHRLSGKSYIAQNGPQTNQGIMTNGDYSFLAASDKRFYALYTQSFSGPFNPPTTVLSIADNIVVSLDNNLRTAPFFSRVKGSSH